MTTRITNPIVSPRRRMASRAPRLLAFPLLALLSVGCASGPATYSSPDAAADGLVKALCADDPTAALKRVLGPEGEGIITSGDEVADRYSIGKFLAAYDERHSFVDDGDGRKVLQVGTTDWPLPIPLVADGGKWHFDAEAGKDEILSRRIGRNELSTVQTCLAIFDAQLEYSTEDPDGDGLAAYAPKILSDPGKRNGLFWRTAPGEPASPLGALVAAAAAEGYTSALTPEGKPLPFHGYEFRVLTAQGPAARGGALDYLLNGKMIGGFAVVAFPAEYDNSGIMTFIVNHDGVVYQKDLGPDTTRAGRAMSQFDPGEGWQKVDAMPLPDEGPRTGT